jgi:type I restriction enzyme, R subunit
MELAGYTREEFEIIKKEVTHFEAVRQEVKLSSGDYVDMKMLEPAMRHLIDTYIKADDSEVLADFDEMGLIELIVEKDVDEIESSMPKSMRKNQEAMAEAIENNMRKLIIDENPVNPKYFDKMSELLDELIKERKNGALEYKKYLEKIKELASKVTKPNGDNKSDYPTSLDSSAKRALYDNLGNDEILAIKIDTAIRYNKDDSWIGNMMKERKISKVVKLELGEKSDRLEEIMELIKHQYEYR